MLKRIAITLLASIVFGVGVAGAHAMLEGASPADGETLKAAPKEFRLSFGHEVHLTSIKLSHDDGEIAVAVDRKAAAARTFAIAAPVLGPGSYRLNWRALASDGHAMSGHLSFSISRQ